MIPTTIWSKDLEDEHDGAEPPEDDEPSLGSFDRIMRIRRFPNILAGEGRGVVHELDEAERSRQRRF
jgi:hypothetical protein